MTCDDCQNFCRFNKKSYCKVFSVTNPNQLIPVNKISRALCAVNFVKRQKKELKPQTTFCYENVILQQRMERGLRGSQMVECMDLWGNVKVYDSLTQAGDSTGILPQRIKNAIETGKPASGLIWRKAGERNA